MFDGADTKTTPKHIAAGVRKSARLQAAEARLAQLKDRRTEVGKEIRRLNGLPPGPAGETVGAQDLRSLDAEARALAEQTSPVRREVIELRAEHGARVRGALMPTIAAAAARGHDALVELRDVLDTIEAVNHELIRAGSPEYFLLAPDLGQMTERLARLAGRG